DAMIQTENPASRASLAFDDYRRAILLRLDPAARAASPLRLQGRGNPTLRSTAWRKWRSFCASKRCDPFVTSVATHCYAALPLPLTTLAANARGSSKAAESLLAQFSLPIDTANTVPQLSVNSSSGYADVRLNQAASSSDSSSCHVVMTVASLPSLDMPLAYSRSM